MLAEPRRVTPRLVGRRRREIHREGRRAQSPLGRVLDGLPEACLEQVRIVGATEKPASIPYRADMTLLDAMIAVGGLSEYAAGNKARLVRHNKATGQSQEYGLRIGDLIKRGDSKANVLLQPGDVIIIPESMF